MLRSYRIIKIAVLLPVFAFLLFSAGEPLRNAGLPDIREKLEDYYRKYPQQKIYIHLNQDTYRVGQQIWFKAYLLDAVSHRTSDLSRIMVVELVNSFGKTSMSRLLKLENGMAGGDFFLADTLPEGLYHIRAYTNWMRNFDPEFFFRQPINIYNPDHTDKLYREDKLENKRMKKESIKLSEAVDISFLPEGGYLVNGLPGRIAFKAVNGLGLGIQIEGNILDEKKNVVTRFESQYLGMGIFEFTPEPDQKYTAEIRTENGSNQKIKLPESLPSGYTMRLGYHPADLLSIDLASSDPEAGALLICQSRGKILHSQEIRFSEGKKQVQIPSSKFPTGILQIVLFDARGVPQMERLTFINHRDWLKVDVSCDKPDYKLREKVLLTVRIQDHDERPVQGNFSIAVSDHSLENQAAEYQSNILSNLLLVSDLKGKIEHPDRYFTEDSEDNRNRMDLLMMTNGWRRFIWDDVVSENYPEVKYPIMKGLSISGKITKSFFDIPIKNLPVTLAVISEFNDVYTTRTNKFGRYSFPLPDYEDTVTVEIRATRNTGRKNLVIYVDNSDLPENEKIHSKYSQQMDIRGTNVFKPLSEKSKDTTQLTTEGIYGNPDNVIYVDETMYTYSNVFEIIQGRVPGVVVTGNSVTIRGSNSFYGDSEPLYLIDNIPVDRSAVASLSPMDVERIEILKGPSASVYGLRGGNGVISIYTKRGHFAERGVLEFEMLGFYRPREFYSPKYGTDFDYLLEDKRTALYWNPDVTTDENGEAELVFYTSEITEKFTIEIEGISTYGIPGRDEGSFEVSP